MRKRIIAVIAVMLLNVFPMAQASAAEGDEPIIFEGAGWGHGVGMSQYGAYARAVEGQTYDQILATYYQGSTIGTIGTDVPDPGDIFTNVASDVTSTTITVLNGPGTPNDGIVVTRLLGGASDPTATLMTRPDGVPNDSITITDTTPNEGNPSGCRADLTIDGVVTTWATGTCDFRFVLTPGSELPSNLIEVTNCRTDNCTFGYGTAFVVVDNGSTLLRNELDCIGDCPFGPVWAGFDMVVQTTLDEYARGIAEVPYSWPSDALKTQAVAARSYGASRALATDHTYQGCFCDIGNSSSDQVYAGWVGDRSYGAEWDAAARETAGEIVAHPEAPDSGIVRAFYASSNGGASEWVKDKWGSDFPYLVSVLDPQSLTEANPRRSWAFDFTASQVVDVVWGTDYELKSADVIETNVSGSAKTVRFTAEDSNGTLITKDLSSATVTTAFGLYSWYFDIDDTSVDPPAPVPGGIASIGVQDPRTGIWTLNFPDGKQKQFYYGDPKDIPFIGDWNGDGTETVGLYRTSVGFLFLRYTNTQGVADVDIYYGIPGDQPIAGDWNGDGVDTIGIYRPSEGRFYLRNTNTQGIADVDMAFGVPGDQPIAGDWDGDGVDTIGVYRSSTRMLYLTNSVPGGQEDFSYYYAGTVAGDRILAGDWDNDGTDTVGVFRPSNATFYLRDTYTQSSANIVIQLGDFWMNAVAGGWG